MLEYKFVDGDTVTFEPDGERVYVRWDLDDNDREMNNPIGYWDKVTKKFVTLCGNNAVIHNLLIEMGMTLEDAFSK